MSVLQKFFQKKNRKSCGIFNRKQAQPGPSAVIELPTKDETQRDEPSVFIASMLPPCLRLVLFQEEASDRRLLFDSKSFEPEKTQAARNESNHIYVRGPQDSDILSEMLFGTVGMASRASSLKIHIMKNPHRLMLSRVFCVESAKDSSSMERGLDADKRLSVSSRRKANTLPVPTPEASQPSPLSPYQSLASSFTSKITRSDSSSSLMALFGASIGTTGSLGSRPNAHSYSANKAHSLPPARQASRDSFTLTQEPHSGIVTRRTKVKIGFGVIFQPEPADSSEFQTFFFEHFPLVESYVTFLKEHVENALNNFKKGGKSEFIEAMMEALHVFSVRIQSIYSTPRLPRPVWPTLMSQTNDGLPWRGESKTIECFISELARMVHQHNTKQKNFFMTGLITSVLTNHLGWVNATMSGDDCSQDVRAIAYNPLWAQLGDLYGAVGTPTKVAKTVVVGDIHEIVSTIISILSYFIRCSKVEDVLRVPADFSPQAFSGSVKMSYVPSDIEASDYVLVELDDVKEAPGHVDMSKNAVPTPDPKPCQSPARSDPIDVGVNVNETLNVSLLCRSKSSPVNSVKPQPKFRRQQSSGRFENLSPRMRTNSNDTFAKPRSVQSRRTSRKIADSTISIPDDVDFKSSNPNQNAETRKETNSLSKDLPLPKPRTHKRVSSEPFTVSSVHQTPVSTSMVKTKSTYFPTVRQETFAGSIEPRVVRVAHVQRVQPVLAQSPHLSGFCKTGFETNQNEFAELKKRKKSGFHDDDSPKSDCFETNDISPKTTPKTAPTVSDSPQFHFDERKSHRRSVSTEGGRNAKPKIATRRRNLNAQSAERNSEEKNFVEKKMEGNNFQEQNEKIVRKNDSKSHLPPLQRIPSISLEHDEFAQYFSEDEHKAVFFVGRDNLEREKPATPVNHNGQILTETQNSEQAAQTSNVTNSKKSPPPLPSSAPVFCKAPPLPSRPPVHKGRLYPNLETNDTGPSQRPTDLPLPGPAAPLYPVLTNVDSKGPRLQDSDVAADDKRQRDASECLSLKTEIPLCDVDTRTVNGQEGIGAKKKLKFADLMADYSPEYLWGFALHGTRQQPSLITSVTHELQQATSIPVLDEQIAEAVTIIADTDKWSVKVLSSHRMHSDKLALPALTSKLVNEILEKIKMMYHMNVPASFCMQQLELSLGELVMKSKMLADYVSGSTRLKMNQLSAILGIESNDLPLLMAIASCHSPQVAVKLF